MSKKSDGNNSQKETFTASTGRTITLIPVSPFALDELEAGFVNRWIKEHGDLPKPPTYEAIVGDGENPIVEEYEYDNDSIIEGTEEEKEAYQKYLKDMARYNGEWSKVIAEFVIGYGCIIEEYDKQWIEMSETFNMEIPKNEIQKKIKYVENWICGQLDDLPNLINRLVALGGIDTGLVEETIDKFRD